MTARFRVYPHARWYLPIRDPSKRWTSLFPGFDLMTHQGEVHIQVRVKNPVTSITLNELHTEIKHASYRDKVRRLFRHLRV